MSEKIPFDIEKWETGEYEAVYRNGEKPLEIHFFKCVEIQPLASVSYEKELLTHSAKGQYIYSAKHELDIFLTPKKKKGWVIVYEINGNIDEAILYFDCRLKEQSKERRVGAGHKIIHESEFEY
jgi:hypothetical protein